MPLRSSKCNEREQRANKQGLRARVRSEVRTGTITMEQNRALDCRHHGQHSDDPGRDPNAPPGQEENADEQQWPDEIPLLLDCEGPRVARGCRRPEREAPILEVKDAAKTIAA